jgi:predicted phosphodiesterase
MMRPGILLLFAVALLVSPAVSVTTLVVAPILVQGPYLTPAPDGIMVHLRIDQAVEVTVEYGEEKACSLNGTCPLRIVSPVATDHQILLTGLSPGTRYRYRVQYGDQSTGGLHFLTCPTSGPVNFLVLGDTRDQPPGILQEERFGAVANRAAIETGINFLVLTGDFVLDGNREEDWDRFFRIGGAILANTTLLPVRGNHDGSPDQFMDLFGVPLNYSFSCGDVQLAVLDSNDDAWQDLPSQALWLDRALGQGPPIKFAALHYPLFSSDESHFGGWENLREAFGPVLSGHGIRAVFQGHVHLYERDQAGGIQYVTDARGGAPPYRFGAGRIPEYQNGLEDSLGYSLVTVRSLDLPAILNVIQVADLREGRVMILPSEVLVERVLLPPRCQGTGFGGLGSTINAPSGRTWGILAGNAFLAQEVDLVIRFPPASPS